MKVPRVTLVVTVVMLLTCTAFFANSTLLQGVETAESAGCGAYLVTFRSNDGSDDYHWDYEHRGVRECVVRIYHTHRNAGYELTKRPGELHDYDFYGNYLMKGNVSTVVMRTLADMHPDAVLVPLDDDEILRDPTGEPVTRESLFRLSDEAREWKTGRAKMTRFTTRVCEKEGERMRFVGVKRRNVEMTYNLKTMFRAKSFEATDHGNHHGVTVETHGADYQDLAQYDISEFRMVDVSGDLTFGQWYDKIYRRYTSSTAIPLEQCAEFGKNYCEAGEALMAGRLEDLRARYALRACYERGDTRWRAEPDSSKRQLSEESSDGERGSHIKLGTLLTAASLAAALAVAFSSEE